MLFRFLWQYHSENKSITVTLTVIDTFEDIFPGCCCNDSWFPPAGVDQWAAIILTCLSHSCVRVSLCKLDICLLMTVTILSIYLVRSNHGNLSCVVRSIGLLRQMFIANTGHYLQHPHNNDTILKYINLLYFIGSLFSDSALSISC